MTPRPLSPTPHPHPNPNATPIPNPPPSRQLHATLLIVEETRNFADGRAAKAEKEAKESAAQNRRLQRRLDEMEAQLLRAKGAEDG